MKFLKLALQAAWRKIKHPGIKQIAMGCKPDPFKFTIIHKEFVNGHTIVVAKYHGCTSFGGRKLMVVLGKLEGRINCLDPHFINEDYPVVARFMPTTLGWKLARITAENINED